MTWLFWPILFANASLVSTLEQTLESINSLDARKIWLHPAESGCRVIETRTFSGNLDSIRNTNMTHISRISTKAGSFNSRFFPAQLP